MKVKTVCFPVCIFLLFLYCILAHVPDNFWTWLILAALGDFLLNPLIEIEGE